MQRLPGTVSHRATVNLESAWKRSRAVKSKTRKENQKVCKSVKRLTNSRIPPAPLSSNRHT